MTPGRHTADSSAPESTVVVDVVLPCLDEELALPAVLAGLPAGYRAIVVDNGSSDRSAAVAAAHGALVVTEPVRGFGSAAHAGLLAATAPVVAFCDADGSLDLGDLPRVVDPVVAGEADLVLARRVPNGRGAWPLLPRLANRSLARRIRRSTGLALTDLGPMRAARREALLALDLRDRRSGYPLEMVLSAWSAGLVIRETSAPYTSRVGRSKVTGTARGFLGAVRDMSAQFERIRTPEVLS